MHQTFWERLTHVRRRRLLGSSRILADMGKAHVFGRVVGPSYAIAALAIAGAACSAESEMIDGGGEIPYSPSDATTKDAGSDRNKAGDSVSVQPDTGAAGADSGDAGKVDGSDSDGGVKLDGGDAGGDGGSIACTNPGTCAVAASLGTVSGDTGSGTISYTGTTSRWISITVSEDDHTILTPKALKAEISLSSPTGVDFDLYVYDGCGSLLDKSTNLSGIDSVAAEWPDLQPFPSGHDDTKTLYIEVRHRAGSCSASSKWSLQVRGNYP